MERREFFLWRGFFRSHFLTGAWEKRKSEGNKNQDGDETSLHPLLLSIEKTRVFFKS
jgi:hypothetical protein